MGNILVSIVLFIFALLVGIVVYLIRSFKDPIREDIQYDDNLKIYPGGGCNSIVLTAADKKKALIVDTKYFKGAKYLRNQVTSSDITIINTHFHVDHARGNKLYPHAHVISGACSWKHWDFDTGHGKRPDHVLDPGEELKIKFGDETIRIINMGSNHTATDCVVYLEKRKVLAAGDIVWNQVHPMVMDPNCNISSWIKTLHRLDNEFEINTIVPGHGDITDKSVLTEMREYFLSLKNALADSDRLRLLKNKYKGMKSLPIITGLRKTVKKLKKEAKAVRNNLD